MIEKKRRITRGTFVYDPKQRHVFHGKFITMTQYLNNSTPNCCFTVVVSKKNYKKAVERNYLKRIVYESVKANTTLFDHKYKGNIVFSYKHTTPSPTFLGVHEDIRFFLENT